MVLRKSLEPRIKISCMPCLRDTITAEATKCCKTCKDPEPLCDDCADRHTRMEANKGHEMTDDLQLFPNMGKTFEYVQREWISF